MARSVGQLRRKLFFTGKEEKEITHIFTIMKFSLLDYRPVRMRQWKVDSGIQEEGLYFIVI